MTIKNEYPKHALPQWVLDCAENYCKVNISHFDGLATNVLNVCGLSLCNQYQIQVKEDWFERPNLWSIYISKSGANKSGTLKIIKKNVNEKTIQLVKNYNEKRALYKQFVELHKETRKDENQKQILYKFLSEKGLSNKFDDYEAFGVEALKPKKLSIYGENVTFEALYRTLYFNEGKAFMFAYDEIKGLFNNFNTYRSKGDDEESFLKLFNYESFKKDRVDEDSSYFIKDLTVCIAGTTQYNALNQIFTEDRIQNGNIFRFLFTFDESTERTNVYKLLLNADNLDKNPLEEINEFCNYYLINFESDINRHTLRLNNDISIFLDVWRYEMNEKYKTLIDDEIYNPAMSKMDSYIHRIALIINRLRVWGEYKQTNDRTCLINNDISIEDYKNSGLLVEYYLNTINQLISGKLLKFNTLFKNDEERLFFEELQNEGKYKEYIKLFMDKFNIKESTAKNRFRKLQENGLFKKNSKNMYYKPV